MNQKMMQLLLNKEYGNNFPNNNIGANQQMMKSHQVDSNKVNVTQQ